MNRTSSTRSFPPGTLVERLGRLSDHRLRHICAALEIAVGCDD